jgi:4-(cytidine 5'-diphospho)-2-C-methyl-D-erythritol kinase
MILFPNAKINIGLDIIERRPDGYHNVETLMYPVGWRDVLEIVPTMTGRVNLTVSGRSVDCPPEKNLVMKAVRAIEAEKGVNISADIFLRKIIPDGAGLGGGSADAAFTLVGINKVFNLGLDEPHLATIASAIGADCPFFIYNRPMIATGTGTQLTPCDLSLAGLNIAIVKPSRSVATRQAYAGVKPATPQHRLADSLGLSVDQWLSVIKNDFEPSIFPQLPECAAIKELLIEMGAQYASLSGSGSAVYGIFDRDILSERLTEDFPECDIWCGILD